MAATCDSGQVPLGPVWIWRIYGALDVGLVLSMSDTTPVLNPRRRGVLLADYHIVRRQQLKLLDLYTGDVSSIYWYFHGLNWRGPVAFVAGMWPLLRKDTPSALMHCSFKLTCP
jgi:cytosine/uracil/thiamine/allantoin permease